MTNVFDAANRLTSTTRASTTLQVAYNGFNDRVRQTVGAMTTSFILDSAGGLPEVISTTRGTSYLHLPGVIMAQNSSGQRVYLLPDGLGSIRQVMSGTNVIAQRDFDPYGNPISTPSTSIPPYGFTGEWWEQDAQLLHLRARWYLPQDGIFLSKDSWAGEETRSQSLNGWSYVEGNPVNWVDPSGFLSECKSSNCKIELITVPVRNIPFLGHYGIVHTDQNNKQRFVDALPEDTSIDWLTVFLSGDIENLGSPAYWNPRTHPTGGIAGIIKAHVIEDDEVAIQSAKENSQTAIAVVAEGETVCDKWEKCLKSQMEQVEKNRIGYRLFGPNSDSAAISVLRHCGLPWIRPAIELSIKIPWRSHTGWVLDLLSSTANDRQQ